MDKEVTSEEQPARRALIDLAKLRSLISAQIERISQSHFVRERDFHSILSVLHPKINVHVITRHAGLIVHRLSYVRRNGEVKRIPRHYRDPARYAAILAQQNVEWRHGTVLLVSKRHALPEQARAAIQRHLNVLTIQTQIWRNLRRDATNDAVKEFQSDIVKWSSRPIEELSRYIATRFVCVVGVINKIENARDPENSNSALTAEYELVHCTAAPIPPYLLATVRSESVQQLCSESLRYAKVVDASFDLPNQSPSDSGNINEDIFLLPLCRVTEISSPRNQLLIVHRTLTADPSANFTQEEILAMQEIVSQYADHYTRHAGLKALAAMTRMSAELSSSTIEQSDYSPKTEAITLFNWFSRAVVESTQARSCVIRLLNPARNVLDVKGCYIGPEESRQDKTLQTGISVGNVAHSLDAFTFRHGAIFQGCCYLPNTRKIPRDYKAAGLLSTTASRDDTQSEACLVIDQGAVAVGTIHIESPLTDAFRSELEYLNVAGRLLSKIYSTLHTVNDARFIAERLSIFNLQHELPKYLDRIRQLDVNMAIFLQEEFLDLKYGSPDRPDDVDDFSLGLLVDRVKQRHEALLGRECVATSLRYLHISPLVPSLRADQHVRQAIGYVLDNLLSNAINYRSTKTKIKVYPQFGRAKQGPSESFSGSHDPVPQTPLVFRHRRDLPICGKFTLIIEYVIGKRLDPETALALGVRPVFNEDNASYRLGLFIVGLIVRQLGGYIEPMEDNGTTVLQIRIPLVAAPT